MKRRNGKRNGQYKQNIRPGIWKQVPGLISCYIGKFILYDKNIRSIRALIMQHLLQCTKDYNKNGLPTYNFYRSSKERYFIFLKCNDYMLQLRAKLARRLIS